MSDAITHWRINILLQKAKSISTFSLPCAQSFEYFSDNGITIHRQNSPITQHFHSGGDKSMSMSRSYQDKSQSRSRSTSALVKWHIFIILTVSLTRTIVAPSNLCIIAPIGMEVYNSALKLKRDQACRS